MNTSNHKIFLIHDLMLIIFSIFIAVVLVQTDILIKILTSTQELELLGSFIAGIFFTSVFTTAPAIVTLGEIAQNNSIISVAVLGSIGAVIGDLVIFYFFRDRFTEHIMELVQHQGIGKRIKVLLKQKSFRWLTFFVGGLIIASPLPDELGISLLGFSKMRTSWFIPLSLIFNFLGILLIGWIAKAL